MIPGFPLDRDSILDVTVVNPLQRNSVEEAAHTAVVAMRKAKERKRTHYRGRLQGHQQIFLPVAFETLGGWDEESVILMKRITTILARNQGKEEAECYSCTAVPGTCIQVPGKADRHRHPTLERGVLSRQGPGGDGRRG